MRKKGEVAKRENENYAHLFEQIEMEWDETIIRKWLENVYTKMIRFGAKIYILLLKWIFTRTTKNMYMGSNAEKWLQKNGFKQ